MLLNTAIATDGQRIQRLHARSASERTTQDAAICPSPADESRRSHALRAAGADPAGAARSVACDWVRANPSRWRPWIPPTCPPGSSSTRTVDQCDMCPAGSYCPGQFADAVPCPRGAYCPAGAASPTPCPAGRTTPFGMAVAAGNCSECAASAAVLLGGYGACVSLGTLIPAIALPLAVLLCAMAVLYHLRRVEEDQSLWKIRDADVTVTEPVEVHARVDHLRTYSRREK